MSAGGVLDSVRVIRLCAWPIIFLFCAGCRLREWLRSQRQCVAEAPEAERDLWNNDWTESEWEEFYGDWVAGEEAEAAANTDLRRRELSEFYGEWVVDELPEGALHVVAEPPCTTWSRGTGSGKSLASDWLNHPVRTSTVRRSKKERDKHRLREQHAATGTTANFGGEPKADAGGGIGPLWVNTKNNPADAPSRGGSCQ
jgi:hypothetical protein